ncbi:MAG: V4R domain-containing protein, partial [Candidatus Heimdallarchaeota archaeon]
VHIGILQSIVTSILAINPRSSEFLYRVGRDMGRFGNVQFRFLRHYPQIFERVDIPTKFRDILEGLQELYSANSLGLPLYLASKSLIQPVNDNKAILTVYDSAFSAQMPPIGQPVCYLIAGEISGLVETTLGENVSVVETRCFGLGDPFCQFEIELNITRDFSFTDERPFLTKGEKEKFQRSLDSISKNMYSSSLIRTVLRPGVSDHVHISVLQQAMNGIKFSDPFFSTLLFYAGLHYGRHGADYAIMERLIRDKKVKPPPLEFEDALKSLREYFNDPATILTRWQGHVKLIFEDEETAYLQINESAISSGLNMKGSDFLIDSDGEIETLCDFTSGFIQGRLSKITSETINVVETKCQSMGTLYCEFKVAID